MEYIRDSVKILLDIPKTLLLHILVYYTIYKGQGLLLFFHNRDEKDKKN